MYIRSQLPLWNPLRTACGSWLSTIPLSLADVGFLSDTILSDVSSIYCMKEGGVFFGNCVVSYRCRGVGVSVAWFPTRGDSFWPSCSWFLLFFFFVFFFFLLLLETVWSVLIRLLRPCAPFPYWHSLCVVIPTQVSDLIHHYLLIAIIWC